MVGLFHGKSYETLWNPRNTIWKAYETLGTPYEKPETPGKPYENPIEILWTPMKLDISMASANGGAPTVDWFTKFTSWKFPI